MKQPMALADHAHFIGAWLRNPLQTGALWPSGQSLARAMARHADLHRPGPVVELGAGTGAITRALLAEAGTARPGTLVSGLALVGMTRRRRWQVLEQIFACLDPGGALVQFTYSPLAPIPRAVCAALGLSGRRVALVTWNLPPAAVWIYTRPAEA